MSAPLTNDGKGGQNVPIRVPWGTDPGTPEQGRISTTSTGFKKNKPGFRTIYTLDFQGLPSSRPQPQRAETSDHLPTGWPFETTHYSSTFTPKQYSRYTVQPASVHRRNNPHPTLYDPWKYPDMRYQIWKPRANALDTIRESKSAPNLIRNDRAKGKSWSTTYDVSFAGKNFDNFPKIKPRTAAGKVQNKWNVSIQTPPLHMMSMYRHDFIGDRGRPSTIERPWDRSFQNLNM